MYQEFFGFDTRPFPTHGAPPPFIPTPATDEALPPLERCAREGRGIAILSAPAGTGKTAVAQEVGRRLSDALHVVYLGSSNYTSRRGLLQAMLFELGLAYAGLSEQEARLQVIEFARGLLPERDGLVLLVDEADQLSERLLEELRALANYMHEGRPLLRLVLCGQLELDERLAAPELDAFNQRVGCQAVLEPLDRKQSAAYIHDVLAACGAELEDVFSAEALNLICVASDGNIRCLHHLCDHSLLLAFVAEEKPVPAATVRAALEDLQGLPLSWNVPAAAPTEVNSDTEQEPVSEPIEISGVEIGGDDTDDETAEGEMAHREPDGVMHTESEGVGAEATVIEFGGDVQHEALTSPSTAPAKELVGTVVEESLPSVESHSVDREFRLQDRYAELDRLAELDPQETEVPPIAPATDMGVPAKPDPIEDRPDRPSEIPVPDPAAQQTLEGKLLAEITDMRVEVRHVTSCDDAVDGLRDSLRHDKPLSGASSDEAEWDVVQPEDEIVTTVLDTGWRDSQESESAEDPPPIVATQPQIAESGIGIEGVNRLPGSQTPIDSDDGSRRYAFLFTRLRNRRRDLAARTTPES